ncbi:hypothetical protein GX586_13240 [bacterium]|nr:hypothetical protein [bacterium]
MKTLATCLLSGLLLVSIASATTPDELPADWGSDVAEFAINGTYLGMTKADVTNSNAMFLRIKPPQSTLDVISYLVLSTTEDKVNIGHTRTNVVLDVVKNVYFNTDGRAVAIEMVFMNLDPDKKRALFERIDRKYDPLPGTKPNYFRYAVSDRIGLESTAIPTATDPGVGAGDKPSMFTIKNFYFHKAKYPEALRGTKKEILFQNML